MHAIHNPGIRHSFTDFASLQGDFDPNTLTTGLVSTFTNSGPAGGSFTAAGSARPTCIDAGLNGHKGIVANGTTNIMDTTLVGSDLIAAHNYTIFCVCTINTIDTNFANSYDNDSPISCGNEFLGLHLSSVPQFQAFHWDGAKQNDIVSTTTGSPVLLQQRYDGTKIYGRSGSAAEGTGGTAGDVANVGQTWRLFRNYTTSYFDGTLWRLLIFNTSLSASDLILVRARLNALYGVAV